MTSRSILFADDDVLTQWIMTEVLTDAGFDVVGACRGAEAIRLMEESSEFDLLITDVDLPDNVSGLDIGHMWRKALPGRPVIYTGASQNRATRRLEGDEHFLVKPFSPELLLSVIELAFEDACFAQAMPALSRGSCHVH